MKRIKASHTVLSPNRQLKNDLFGKLYEDEKDTAEMVSKLLHLDPAHVRIKNLKPILLGNKANDLSFLRG